MLTHLSREQADVSQLAAIYRARWAVEIQFRAWKQALNLSKALNRPQSQEQRTSFASPGAGRDDRPPAWHEDGPADRKHSRTGKTEL